MIDHSCSRTADHPRVFLLVAAMGEPGESEKAFTHTQRTDDVQDGADGARLGGHLKDLPPGYYRSPKFVGSMLGVILMANSLYLGFVLPVGRAALSASFERDKRLIVVGM